jgi:hypothetical protein
MAPVVSLYVKCLHLPIFVISVTEIARRKPRASPRKSVNFFRDCPHYFHISLLHSYLYQPINRDAPSYRQRNSYLECLTKPGGALPRLCRRDAHPSGGTPLPGGAAAAATTPPKGSRFCEAFLVEGQIGIAANERINLLLRARLVFAETLLKHRSKPCEKTARPATLCIGGGGNVPA